MRYPSESTWGCQPDLCAGCLGQWDRFLATDGLEQFILGAVTSVLFVGDLNFVRPVATRDSQGVSSRNRCPTLHWLVVDKPLGVTT